MSRHPSWVVLFWHASFWLLYHAGIRWIIDTKGVNLDAKITVFVTIIIPSGLFLITCAALRFRNHPGILGQDAIITAGCAATVLFLLLSDTLQHRSMWCAMLFLAAAGIKIFNLVRIELHEGPIQGSSLWVFLIGFALLGGAAGWTWAAAPASGDEPHYLMLCHSLITDADLDLWDEYEQRIYKPFYDHELLPKPSDVVTPGMIYSGGLGALFPILLMPAYLVGGRLGAQLCIVAATGWLLVLCRRHYLAIAPPLAAWFGLTAVFLTLPLGLLSQQLYPDVLAALMVMLAYGYLTELHPQMQRTERRWRVEMIACCSLLLALLRFRYVPLAACLILLVIQRISSQRRHLWFGLLGAALAFGLYLILDKTLLGGTLFFTRFGKIYQIRHYLPGLRSIFAAFGLLLGQEEGLLLIAPVLLSVLLINDDDDHGQLLPLVLIIPYITTFSGHGTWHSLPTTPLRYLAPIVPLAGILVVKAAARLLTGTVPQRILMITALGWSIVYWTALTLVPGWRYNMADGTNQFLEDLSQVIRIDLTRLFPSMIRVSWTGVVFVAVVTGLLLHRLAAGRRPMAKAGLAAVALAVICIIAGRAWWDVGDPGCRLVEAEDYFLVEHLGGTPYPHPKDPFYHSQEYLGWTLPNGARLVLSSPAAALREVWEIRVKSIRRFGSGGYHFGEDGVEAVLDTVVNIAWRPRVAVLTRTCEPLEVQGCEGIVVIDKFLRWPQSRLMSRLYCRLGELAETAGSPCIAAECMRRSIVRNLADETVAAARNRIATGRSLIRLAYRCGTREGDIPGLAMEHKVDDASIADALMRVAIEDAHSGDLELVRLAFETNLDAAVDALDDDSLQLLLTDWPAERGIFEQYVVEMAVRLLHTGRVEAAVALVRSALHNQSDDPVMNLLLAWGEQRLGHEQRARRHAFCAIKQGRSAAVELLNVRLGATWDSLERLAEAVSGRSQAAVQAIRE
ncbi:hypothetical protein JW905_04145 [bacterium]|nr:hypothetical protein [candidate division CSSED10-310 bacterium]